MIGAKLDRLKTREKAGLAIALLFVGMMLVDRMAVRWAVERIRGVETEIRAETDRLIHNVTVIAAEPAVSARYQSLQQRLGSAPSETAALDRLKERIDDLARQNGLVIQTMRDRPIASENDPCLKVAVEIGRFEAEVEALVAFLFAIQEAPEVWRVARLNVAPDQTGRLSGAMTIAQLVRQE